MQIKNQKDFETNWLDVGVRTGEIYPQDGAMDNLEYHTIQFPALSLFPWSNHYTKLKEENGLILYRLQGINPKTGKPSNQDEYANDIYINKNKNGKVTTFISCHAGMVSMHACQHKFSMEYDGVKALIEVYYQPNLRKHWKEIQAKVTQKIIDFRIDKTTKN